MAHIDRPIKTGGTRLYVSEVAAGFDLIRENEVDGDFTTIYGEFNGGIDNTNIRVGAEIDYTKLNLTGQIQGSDLDPHITLPPGTIVPGGGITPGTITITQLVPGAAVQALTSVALSAMIPLGTVGAETLCLEQTWTSRGAHWFALAVLHCLIGIIDTPPAISISSHLRLDSGAGSPTGGTVFSTASVNAPTIVGATGLAPVTLVTGGAAGLGTFLPVTAGTHRITATATISGQIAVLSPAQVQSGYLLICELA